MTTKTFLNRLRKSLSILKEEEKEDILNEYKDIIEEKVKHGKTEEEAVEEFGDYQTLVKGILDAYKINTEDKENTTKEKAKDIISTSEEVIKEGAKRLAKGADKIVSDIKENHTDFTLELIFELILKGLCVLVIMALLTIPFRLFIHLGAGILDITFFPLNEILKIVWKMLVGILYFISGTLIVLSIFKEYIKNPNHNLDKNKEDKIEKSNRKKKETCDQKSNTVSSIFIILCKIFLIFAFILPMFGVIIGLLIAFSGTIFLLIKGIDVIGILLGILGALVFSIKLIDTIYNGLFHHKKITFYPFVISIILMITGAILTIDFITRIDYIEDLPNHVFKQAEFSDDYRIEKETIIDIDQRKVSFKVDSSLNDGEMKVNIFYYEEYGKPRIETYHENQKFYMELHNSTYIRPREMLMLFLDHLRENKIYDYSDLSDFHVEIVTNENTKNLIRFD